MFEEVVAYMEYLEKFNSVKRPPMPKFDFEAYTDNEYMSVVEGLEKDFCFVDDLWLTINQLKGD